MMLCAGIDDVFVLVNTLRNYLEDPKLQALSTANDPTPDREMRLTLALAGPSVVLTTFSVLAAFFISSIVKTFSLNNNLTFLIYCELFAEGTNALRT